MLRVRVYRGGLKAKILALSVLFCSALLLGAAEREQRFDLTAGWNSIYLDVNPASDDLVTVFDTQLVDAVARYFVPTTPVRFIDDAAETPWNSERWSVWYSSRRAESFLNSLHAVHGGAAYLVHAVKDGTLVVRGETQLRETAWKTDSFNLVGFPVEGPGLSFSAYFAGAGNRIGSRVYRLVNGNWQKVVNLSSTNIRPGEAYWVFCEGNTTYQGPLEVNVGSGSDIHFGKGTVSVTVELRNKVNAPFSVAAQIENNNGLPLFRRVVDLANTTAESSPATGTMNLGSLAPGEVTHFRLELREENFNGTGNSADLRFTASNGVVIRVPVRYSAN